MPATASASVSLSARIPDASTFLSLVESLQGRVSGVEAPAMPVEKIQQLVGNFRFELPDPSRWQTTVTADASRISAGLANPSALIAPLEKPVAAAREIANTDFRAAISSVESWLEGLEARAQADPKALVSGMFAPTSPEADLIRNSPFMRLVVAIGRLAGVPEIEKTPDNVLALAKWLQQLLQERIGGLIIAFAAAGQAATLTRRLVRASEGLDASVRLDGLPALRQATIDAYSAALAALRALGTVDPAKEAAATTAILATRSAQQAYVHELTRILAFGEAAAVSMDLPRADARFVQLTTSLASVKLEGVAEVAASAEALIASGRAKVAAPSQPTAASELDATVRRLLVDLKQRVDELDVSGLEQGIDSAFTTLTAPLDQLEKFKEDVEREVRGVLETIRDAISSVDLSPLRTEFERAMSDVQGITQQVGGEIADVRRMVEEGIAQASGALTEARDFVLGEDGLKAQIDAVFGQLRDLLAQLDIQGTVGNVTSGVNEIAAQLERIEIAPVVDATVLAIDVVAAIIDKVAPLLVTDDLRKKLTEATAVLREVDFDAIRAELQTVLDTIIDGVNTDALGRISAEYDKAVQAIGKLDPGPVLEKLQAEVFDPLIAELEKIKPAEAMAPLAAVFDEARATLAEFDPAESLQFLVEFFSEVRNKFGELSPDRLLEPVESALADLRKAIGQTLRIHEVHDLLDKIEAVMAPILEAANLSTWFAQLDDGIAAMRRSIETFDPRNLLGPLAGVLRDAFERTGAVLDRHGLAVLWEALTGSGEPLASQLTSAATTIAAVRGRAASANMAAIIAELRPLHQELRTALTGATLTAGARVELSAVVTGLDPMAALSPVQSRAPRAEAALGSLQAEFTAMTAKASPALAKSQEIIDALRVLRRPLEALWDLLLVPLRSVVAIPEGASIRAILLAGFDAADPRRWKGEITQLADAILGKLRVLAGGTVIAALKRVTEKISALIDGLNIDDLAAALREVYTAIGGQLDALDPGPLIASFRDTYASVIAVLDGLDPGPIIEELDTIYSRDVVGLVRAISPRDLLLEPLRALFGEISAMLGALDIGELFKPVLDQLQRLRTELLDGIERAGVSYEGLIASIPTSGGGGASVSASVSVG